MKTSRRNFLKNSAMTIPSVALVPKGTTFPENTGSMDDNQFGIQKDINRGWINIQEFGASGSLFRTTAITC